MTRPNAVEIEEFSQSHMNSPNGVPASGTVEVDQGRTLADMWKSQLLTMGDATMSLEPIEYIIEDVLPEASLTIVFGSPGTLKSMLMHDAAICVSSGKRWLESDPEGSGTSFATTQGNVLLWDCDNGKRRMMERLAALMRGHGVDETIPLKWISMPDPWMNARDKGSVMSLRDLMLEYETKLLVIDNLGVISGNVDENSSDMVGVMANLRWLAESSGAAIVVIHHARKSADGRSGDSLRGHSSIEASLDLALKVERQNGTSEITVTPTKERGHNLPVIRASFSYSTVGDSTDLDSARFIGIAEVVLDTSQLIDNAILECLQDGVEIAKTPLTKAVFQALKKSGMNNRSAITERLDLLVNEGKIGCRRLPGNAQTYSRI